MQLVLSNGFPHPQTTDDTDVEQLIEQAAVRTLRIAGVRCVMYGTDLAVQFSSDAWAEAARRQTGWQPAANDANTLVAMLNCRDGAHAQILADNHAWSQMKVGNAAT